MGSCRGQQSSWSRRRDATVGDAFCERFHVIAYSASSIPTAADFRGKWKEKLRKIDEIYNQEIRLPWPASVLFLFLYREISFVKHIPYLDVRLSFLGISL